jgi:hypothetical protein
MATRKVRKYARNTNGIARNLLKYFNKENTIFCDSENPKLTVATPTVPLESCSYVYADAANYSLL